MSPYLSPPHLYPRQGPVDATPSSEITGVIGVNALIVE
jgi:hypothetical protein